MFGLDKKKDKEGIEEITPAVLISAIAKRADGMVGKGTVTSAELTDGVGYVGFDFFDAEYHDAGQVIDMIYLFRSTPPMTRAEADEALKRAYPDEDWFAHSKRNSDPIVKVSTGYNIGGLGLKDIAGFIIAEAPYMEKFRKVCEKMGFVLEKP